VRGFEGTDWDGRVFIALGANVPAWPGTPPRMTIGAALVMLEDQGVRVHRRSSWYETAPVPYDPSQPNFVNGAAEVKTRLPARDLMALLLSVETALGRVRSEPNAPRTIDLDLLAYGPIVHAPVYEGDVHLPHPRMCERAFVMTPLAEIAPDWAHPQTGGTAAAYAAALGTAGLSWMPDGGGAFGTEWASAAA
jgi:2-amino-4-hydroxy-6-hydroxymethyldihydropteridine diphosphokinase